MDSSESRTPIPAIPVTATIAASEVKIKEIKMVERSDVAKKHDEKEVASPASMATPAASTPALAGT